MGRKVLVVGAGGREHALAWKLAKSPEVTRVFAAPGNPGIGQVAELVDIAVDDIRGLLEFALREKIDLTVVGPELPLTLGIVDEFRKAGLVIFGPAREAARLEGSKALAKRLMMEASIPTARYAVFADYDAAAAYAENEFKSGRPLVVKADGLAAGKGVLVPETLSEALEFLKAVMIDKSLGGAGNRVVLEERLCGEEVSVFALSDGENLAFLISAQDHKRAYDGDKGPNTGGMGAYTNPPIYTPEVHEEVMETILKPTVKAMRARGTPYTGVIYAGLMLTAEGPRVLEYNVRFGDPECQVIMPLLKSDLFELLYAASTGGLGGMEPEIETGQAVCVVMAAAGYPGSPQKGDPIVIGGMPSDVLVFHAGTAVKDGRLITAGGRVLNVVATAPTLREAVKKVYGAIPNISFPGAHYRRDIAHRALVWNEDDN